MEMESEMEVLVNSCRVHNIFSRGVAKNGTIYCMPHNFTKY